MRNKVWLSPLVLSITLVVVVMGANPTGALPVAVAAGARPHAVPVLGEPSSIPAPQGAMANSCPNTDDYGSSAQLTLQNTVDCAGYAGFSGNLEITFVSMAYQESNFCAGAIESGSGSCSDTSPGCGGSYPDAEGILQEGTAGQCPPVGGPFSVTGYSASSCSTWSGSSTDWSGIYFNPFCSFQWALAYYNYNSYNFWGSYLSGDYCKWAPDGFLGTGSVTCSGTNQNQAGLPWSTVCPGNVCPTPSTLAVTYSVHDNTTGDPELCGGEFAQGDTIQFTGSPSGGTAPYTYAWSFGDNTSGTTNPAYHAYTATGTVTPTLKVTDHNGSTANTGSGCTFTVIAPLRITSFVANPANLTVGKEGYLNVTAAGGASPYSYVYSMLPLGCASSDAASLPCTPAPGAQGCYNVTVTVTDSLNATASKHVAFCVLAPVVLSSVSVSPSPSVLVTGEKGFFSATPACTGGACPAGISYSWNLTNGLGALAPSTTSTVTLTAGNTPGSVTLFVNATLGGTTVESAAVHITINAQTPLTASCSASPIFGVSPLAVLFASTASGGASPYTFAWSFGDGSMGSSYGDPTHTYNSTGRFEVKLTVMDSQSANVVRWLNITVNSTGLPLTAWFTATPTCGNTPLSVQFIGTANGGTAPYAYTWAFGDGSKGSTAIYPTHVYNSSGTFKVRFTVIDAGTLTVTSWTNITASAQGTPFTLTATSNVTAGTAPLMVSFSAEARGGMSPYTIDWMFGDGDAATGGSVTHSYYTTNTQPETFGVSVTATDAGSNTSVKYLNITVSQGGLRLTVELSAAPANLTLGNSTILSAAIFGGEGVYTFEWLVMPTGCYGDDSLTTNCTPAAAGKFPVEFAVSDGNGDHATGWTNITVTTTTAPGPVSSCCGGFSILGLGETQSILLLLLVAVVVLVLVAVAVRLRKPPPQDG
jgi:PKD repeat protein